MGRYQDKRAAPDWRPPPSAAVDGPAIEAGRGCGEIYSELLLRSQRLRDDLTATWIQPSAESAPKEKNPLQAALAQGLEMIGLYCVYAEKLTLFDPEQGELSSLKESLFEIRLRLHDLDAEFTRSLAEDERESNKAHDVPLDYLAREITYFDRHCARAQRVKLARLEFAERYPLDARSDYAPGMALRSPDEIVAAVSSEARPGGSAAPHSALAISQGIIAIKFFTAMSERLKEGEIEGALADYHDHAGTMLTHFSRSLGAVRAALPSAGQCGVTATLEMLEREVLRRNEELKHLMKERL